MEKYKILIFLAESIMQFRRPFAKHRNKYLICKWYIRTYLCTYKPLQITIVCNLKHLKFNAQTCATIPR